MSESEETRSDAKRLLTLGKYCAITFPNTHSALQAEKLLQKHGMPPFIIVPVPRAISTGCGLAVKVSPEDYMKAVDILEKAGTTISGVYNIDKLSGTIDQIMQTDQKNNG